MAKHRYAFDAPNHLNPPKSQRNPSNFAQISRLRVRSIVEKVKCEEFRLGLRKNQWDSVLEAMSVERRRWRCWRRERDGSSGLCVGTKKKGTKCPFF